MPMRPASGVISPPPWKERPSSSAHLADSQEVRDRINRTQQKMQMPQQLAPFGCSKEDNSNNQRIEAPRSSSATNAVGADDEGCFKNVLERCPKCQTPLKSHSSADNEILFRRCHNCMFVMPGQVQSGGTATTQGGTIASNDAQNSTSRCGMSHLKVQLHDRSTDLLVSTPERNVTLSGTAETAVQAKVTPSSVLPSSPPNAGRAVSEMDMAIESSGGNGVGAGDDKGLDFFAERNGAELESCNISSLVSNAVQGATQNSRSKYGGAVSRRGGRIGSPVRNFVRNSSDLPPDVSVSINSNFAAPPMGSISTFSIHKRKSQKSTKDGADDSDDSSPSCVQQISVTSSMDVPSLASCGASTFSQSTPPRIQANGLAKGPYVNFSSDGKPLKSTLPQASEKPVPPENDTCEPRDRRRIDTNAGERTLGAKASLMIMPSNGTFSGEDAGDTERNKNGDLACDERVQSPPPTMVCFAEDDNGDGGKGGRCHTRYQSGLPQDMKLASPCMFSPFSSNLNVLDSPSFHNAKLTPIAGKSCLRSPNTRSSRGTNGPQTPTPLFDTPRVMKSFDTPTAFSWLHSPTQGFMGDPAFGSTPVSHFHREVGGIRDDLFGGGDGDSSGANATSSMPYSKICISPLASSRKHNGKGGNILSCMRSPNSPVTRLPSRFKNFFGSKIGDPSLDVSMAERDVTEDEDLSVLLQLASSTSNGNVFRSPIAQQNFIKDTPQSSLQLPVINSSTNDSKLSPRLSRKPMPGSTGSNPYGGSENHRGIHRPNITPLPMGRQLQQKSSGSAKQTKDKRQHDQQHGLILENPRGDPSFASHPVHRLQDGQHGYGMPTMNISRKQHDGQRLIGGHHQHPPPGQALSHMMTGGQNQGPPRQYPAMGSYPPHGTSANSALPSYPNGPTPHPGSYSLAKRPLTNVDTLSSKSGNKKTKNTTPKKQRGAGGRGSGRSKMSSPPVDATARNAAERLAAANANTPNANAAALAAAILRGVTQRPSGKWQAQLYYAGKSRYIGVFDTREKAALAYEIARERLKADPKDTTSGGGQSPEATEAKVSLARKEAFAGVNEPDPRPPKKK